MVDLQSAPTPRGPRTHFGESPIRYGILADEKMLFRSDSFSLRCQTRPVSHVSHVSHVSPKITESESDAVENDCAGVEQPG